jgi:hypothetical protein
VKLAMFVLTCAPSVRLKDVLAGAAVKDASRTVSEKEVLPESE